MRRGIRDKKGQATPSYETQARIELQRKYSRSMTYSLFFYRSEWRSPRGPSTRPRQRSARARTMEIDPMETYAPAPPEATETQEQDPAGDDIIGSQAKRAVPEASMAPGTASVKRARTPREGVRRGKWTAEVRPIAPILNVPAARAPRGWRHGNLHRARTTTRNTIPPRARDDAPTEPVPLRVSPHPRGRRSSRCGARACRASLFRGSRRALLFPRVRFAGNRVRRPADPAL